MKRILLSITISFVFAISFVNAQNVDLFTFLKSIPGAEVKKLDSATYFKEFYEVMLPQQLDHNNPKSITFKQLVFVGFNGFDKPTVIETEGYNAKRVTKKFADEPTKILKGNMIFVEHRFFNRSVPEPLNWKYLNIEQATSDYHYIRQLFAKEFTGKWVATGISKGGQTATAYKVFYPNDVDVTIPYVAPLNYEKADIRIKDHFNKVGTPECRKNIFDFQVKMLENKKDLLPIFIKNANRDSIKFDYKDIDAETAYDYCVLEFPFSFWQWGYSSDLLKINGVSNDSLIKILNKVIKADEYITKNVIPMSPSMYQFYSEIGYYEYYPEPFAKWLKKKEYPNYTFCPIGSNPVFSDSYIKKLREFINNGPQNMIFIYGELDPWGATAVELNNKSNSLKMVVKNGSHRARITNLDKDQKEQVYLTLEKWLGVKIERK